MEAPEAAALVTLGALIGVYAGAIGIGGGFLIAPLLLFRHDAAPPETITAGSLTVVALVSASASLLAVRDRRIDFPIAGLFSSAAIVGALAGAALTPLLPRDIFAITFAVFLVLIAAFLLSRPTMRIFEPGTSGWLRLHRDRNGETFLYHIPVRRTGLAITGSAIFAAVSGAGAGLLMVPITTRVMRMPHWLGVPTGQSMIFVIALTGVLFQIAAGNADLGSDGPMVDALWLGVGVVLSAPLGRLINRRAGEHRLTRMLALAIVVVAVATFIDAL
jgi:uncharacterized membrane protein YfcA